jgi:pimeloyl-ACP methyl ester carboxylesterase
MTDPIPAWPGELVALGADEVFVRAAPAAADAEPALFVHGLGGSSQNWTDLMDLLREPATAGQQPALACEAIDLPGFGYSPPPASAGYGITARAAAVIALLDQRQRGPVHLVGNSLGGAVCTRVAARRPDLVRTLTLISPALPDLRPRTLPLRLTVICLPAVGPWLMAKFQQLPAEARSSRTIRDVFGDPSLMHPQRRIEEAAELIRRDQLSYAAAAFVGSARSLVAEYTRVGRGTLWHDAARVTAPALVIHGSHDRLVHPAMAGRAARAFRSGRAVVLPGVGHVAMMERPDLVAGEMRTLLAAAGHPAGPSGSGALTPAADVRAS